MKIAIIPLLLAISYGANAAEITITSEDVVRIALERNETSQISEANLERALEQIDRAKSSLYPTLQLEYGVTRSKMSPNLFPNANSWSYGGTVSVNQPISTFGKLSAAIEIAKAQKSKFENDNIATRASVKRVAEALYYTALFNREVMEITKDSYQNTLKNKKALEQRVSFGRISRNENLKMQADVASRKPQYIEAEKNYQSSLIELVNFLALEPGTTLKLGGQIKTLKAPGNPDAINDNFESLAQVRSLNQLVHTSRANEDFARAAYYPDLVLFGSYSPSSLHENFMRDKIFDQENLSFGVSLVFDWPFGGEKINDVAISRIETRITELNVKSRKREIFSRYQDLLQQYENSQKRLEATVTAVKLAQSSYTVALNSFANGTVSQTQLNDSELLLTQNKINHAQNLLQLQLLATELHELATEGIEGGEI